MSEATRLRSLIATYQELNGASVGELETEPSALEFMRHVARNRPFVVRGGAAHWTAVRRWSAAYLRGKMGAREVQVAVTPNGRADAPTAAPDGTLYFAKPLDQTLPFGQVLDHVLHQHATNGPVWYAQTQNDNLRGEYAEIFQDVAHDIPWARIALQQEPDAINMWIGGSSSTTVLHRDPYQNIYVQTVGAKRFVLIPPAETACVNERMLPPASWTLPPDDSKRGDAGAAGFILVPQEGADPVPSALWDPDLPSENSNAFSALCQPLRVQLDPGDMLYLPALWYHKVSQIVGPEGFCCSVNYWYDMDFSGSFYACDRFIRETTLQAC